MHTLAQILVRCDPLRISGIPDREMRAPRHQHRCVAFRASAFDPCGRSMRAVMGHAPERRTSRDSPFASSTPPRMGGGWRDRSVLGYPATVPQSRDAARPPRAPARAGSHSPAGGAAFDGRSQLLLGHVADVARLPSRRFGRGGRWLRLGLGYRRLRLVWLELVRLGLVRLGLVSLGLVSLGLVRLRHFFL